MHIHICAQPAANVLQMCTLISKEHLYNTYSCTCTGAQNTWAKVHATPIAKQCTYTCTYTHTHTHTYAQEYTCASMTLFKHAEEWLLRLKIYAQTCIHIPMYMHACVYPYIYTCRYLHICMFIHTYIHTNTHTHTTCAYAHTQVRLERQRCSDYERS